MIPIVITVLGLAFGSFVNALVWRLHETSSKSKNPSKENLSIINGRSICPDCRRQLTAKDLIPVLSWLFLKGKCRYCKMPISWQYPLVELVTALLFVVSYICWPYELQSVLSWVNFGLFLAFIVIGVALCVYDLKWMTLPNRLVYSLGVLTVLWTITHAVVQSDASFILSATIGSLGFGGLFFVLYQISNGKLIGGGDVRLGFILGALLGWQYSIIGLTVSAYLATVLIVLLVVMRKYRKNMQIPFGPFLLAGAYVAAIWGGSILDWYIRISGAS